MIRISDYLSMERIAVLQETEKDNALREVIRLFPQSNVIQDIEEFEKALFERENIMSTSIGLGIAVPHVRLKCINEMTMAIGVSKIGIDYKAFDDMKVFIIIMIAAPAGTHRQYLNLLAKIALLLKNDSLRENIKKAYTSHEVFAVLKDY